MKKKNKIILGALSTISIGSLIVGASLGCTIYQNNDKQTTSNNPKKQNNVLTSTPNLQTKNINNDVTYNDNAYLETINQPGTINPFSGAWTKTTALNYTVKNINDMVAVFGVSSILHWVLIQNFNYNINQYIKNINANIFSISVLNFDYSITKSKNNNNLNKFSCTINFNIQFKATCNLDNNSITFSNNYTYNNVQLVPMVMSIGNNGYSYLQLVNAKNETFVPNAVNYCQNAKISSGWTNKDFEYLLGLNWLPIANSYSLTTSNYQYALPAACMRSFNDGTFQTTIGQLTFINFVSQYELYTFNVGFKFNDLSKLVIECNNQYSANNEYEVSPNQLITLSINSILSTINPSIDHSVSIEWQQQTTKNNQTTWNDVYNGKSYSFNILNNGVYRAVATFANGKSTISNSLTIKVKNDSLLIASKKNSYDYDSSCTLYIPDNQWANIAGITYHWMKYDSSTGQWVKAPQATNSPTYTFTVYKTATYELIINDGAGFSIESNSLTINVVKNSVTISASATNVNYGDSVKLSVDTTKWVNNPNLIYTWTLVTSNSSTSHVVDGVSEYHFAVTNDVLCKLVITSKINKDFSLPSNVVSINVNNDSIILSVSGLSANESNIYQLNYGKSTVISIDNSYWNSPNLKNTWTYQWEGYGLNKDGKYEWQAISNPQNTNSLSINSIDMQYSIYQLILINKHSGLQLTSANVITINLVNQNAIINASSATENTNGANTIAVEQGSNVNFKVASNSYWGQIEFTNDSSYKYEWFETGSNKVIAHGSSFTINQVTKNSSYYLVIFSTLDPNFKVTSNTIGVEVNLTYPLIECTSNTASIGYGQQITLKLQPGMNDFWFSSGITYHWCTFKDGVISKITAGSDNYYQAVTNTTYTPFITEQSIDFCLQATIDNKHYYSNIINVGYTNQSQNVDITLNGTVNQNQTLPYYPSTYNQANNLTNTLSIAKDNYWTHPNIANNVKLSYQWTSYQINPITGQEENVTNLASTNGVAYETHFNQVNNGTTYYKLVITQEIEVTVNNKRTTIEIGNPVTNTIIVSASSLPVTCQVDATYGNISNVSNSIYQCQYGSWAQLELAATANPNQQIVYNGCQYQWQEFNGQNWGAVSSGNNIDGVTSGTISGDNLAQFACWINTYSQYRLHIYLTNPDYNPNNANSNQYTYSIYSDPLTFNVVQNTINIGASLLSGTSTVNDTLNNNQFSYGAKIKLSINNDWTSAYNNYVQYIWQVYDNDAEQWINYDYTTQSFSNSADNSTQTIQGSNSCEFYFTQNGQYRLVVQYWKDNNQSSTNDHPYLAYRLTSNILNLQVDHGNVYINATGDGLVANKNNSNEYQTSYNNTVNFGIESGATNYYVQNKTQYVFNWTWTIGDIPYKQSYAPTTDSDAYAPSNIDILGYTTVNLTITLNKNNPNYYAAFKLVADNSIYITSENSSISVQYTNNNQVATSGTCNYADSLNFNIINTDYWYGKVGYMFYWCAVRPDGSWIVLDNGTSSATGASYSTYANGFDNSNVINYQLLLVKDPSQAFVTSNITINHQTYTHITHINNVFALRSNVLTIKIANANCNIICNNTSTNGNSLSQTINYGSPIALSFDSNYFNIYQNQTAKNIVYRWQENSGNGWTNINDDLTSTTYNTSALTNKIQYRLELSWKWNSDAHQSFTIYSYVVMINVVNANISISVQDLTNNEQVTNGENIAFGSQLKLTISPSYWQTAPTVKKYLWTQSSNSSTSENNYFDPYALGEEGQIVTYTLVIILNDGSTLTNNFSVKIIDATTTIAPTTTSGNSLVLDNGTYTINYGSLCKINVSGYWAAFVNNASYKFTLTYNGNDLQTNEFLAQSGTYQLIISNSNWGNYSVSSNLISITTDNNTLSLTAVANNQNSSVSENSGTYNANYGTSIKLKIASGFTPGELATGYTVTKTYQWYFVYSYVNQTKNSIEYSSAVITGATHDNLNIYLLASSSYNLIETYTVKNANGLEIGSITVNTASYLNLKPTNLGICSIKCTNYQINLQGVYVAPYLSSPKLQLTGWLSNDANITNNASISYNWMNYTTNKNETNNTSDYTIDALTSQSQYGLTIDIPTITQEIYTNNGLTTTSFKVVSNVITFKMSNTTISVNPSEYLTSSNNNSSYTIALGTKNTLQLTSNDESNEYWLKMWELNKNDVICSWYDLSGQLSNSNPLTDMNGNSVSGIVYNTISLSLPKSVNYTTRTYYLVMTYTKNGHAYTITSNEVTLVVNTQPTLTTTINGKQETITNEQNISLLFGDQQTISFDYSASFGVSQSDWNPQIYVNGINVTQTTTNKNKTLNINGVSYPYIPLTINGDTYSFQTYPTAPNGKFSYQVVINDASANPNPAYPLKSVIFNVVPLNSKITIANNYKEVQNYNSETYDYSVNGYYPYSMPIQLQLTNSTNNSNNHLPANPVYQWYKVINGTPTAIPNISPSSDWPQTFSVDNYSFLMNSNNTPLIFNFTPSVKSNTDSYSFYLVNGMSGDYELGITNNGVTLMSNIISIKMGEMSQAAPQISGFDGSSSLVPGTNLQVSLNSPPNNNVISFGLPTWIYSLTSAYGNNTPPDFPFVTTQQSYNGTTYQTVTNNILQENESVYWRLEYNLPFVKQIDPFNQAQGIINFTPIYSNVVNFTCPKQNGNLEAYNNSTDSQSVVDLNEIGLGMMFNFNCANNSFLSQFSNPNGLSNDYIVMLQERNSNGWQDISYCDANTAYAGSTTVPTPQFPYFKPDLYYKYDFTIFGFTNISSSFATITSYTPLYFRIQVLVPNTWTSSTQYVFEPCFTSNVVTISPSVVNINTYANILDSSFYYYDYQKYGYVNVWNNGNYMTSSINSMQLPWIYEVGETAIDLAWNINESWVGDTFTNLDEAFKVKNIKGQILPTSDFLKTISPFTDTTATGDKLSAMNYGFNGQNSITEIVLDANNTNDFTGSLTFIPYFVLNGVKIDANPFVITFQNVQSNEYWSIQPSANIKETNKTSNTFTVNANSPINWNCLLPNESASMNTKGYTGNGLPINPSGLTNSGFYTFDIQYFDPISKQWISYFNPWSANSSFLTLNCTNTTSTFSNNTFPNAPALQSYNGGSNYFGLPSYYLFNSTQGTNWSVSSQSLLDNLAYNNWNSWINNLSAVPTVNGQSNVDNWAPYQTLSFPSLNSWSVNPFSWNIAKSGKYRIAMCFSLINFATPTPSQIKNWNLEVYSPVYTFDVNQTTTVQLSSKNNSTITETSQNGLTFYQLAKNGTYDLSYASSVVDWNGDGEYNQATLTKQYNENNTNTWQVEFKPDTVSKDQYAMLWGGPVVILQYQWIYYPLDVGNSTTLETWTNSIKGYDPTGSNNSAIFNGIYENASSGQILGLASGSTTQYQPGTGLNPQDVLANANVTLTGSTLQPGIYELEMEVLYTSFVGIMVNSYNSEASTNTPYNWNVFGKNANDVYTTVTSNPIIILPFNSQLR